MIGFENICHITDGDVGFWINFMGNGTHFRYLEFLKGFDILTYSLTAFLALGCEGILAFVIEQNLYRCTIKEFNTWQSISPRKSHY